MIINYGKRYVDYKHSRLCVCVFLGECNALLVSAMIGFVHFTFESLIAYLFTQVSIVRRPSNCRLMSLWQCLSNDHAKPWQFSLSEIIGYIIFLGCLWKLFSSHTRTNVPGRNNRDECINNDMLVTAANVQKWVNTESLLVSNDTHNNNYMGLMPKEWMAQTRTMHFPFRFYEWEALARRRMSKTVSKHCRSPSSKPKTMDLFDYFIS